jgi:hypothetical protein
METKEGKKYHAGDRVRMSGKGKVMDKAAMEKLGLKAGDTVLCIDPESSMRRNEENEMHWTVYEAAITRITRYTGIRTEETSHNYLREDGLWSNENDEVSE